MNKQENQQYYQHRKNPHLLYAEYQAFSNVLLSSELHKPLKSLNIYIPELPKPTIDLNEVYDKEALSNVSD